MHLPEGYGTNKGYLAAMGAISEELGLMKFETLPRPWDTDDTVGFLKRLVTRFRGQKLCVFWDRASYHNNETLRTLFRQLDVAWIINVPY
mgnify:CR=1 FL=1